MQNKRIGWCFNLKDGLKIAEPNERLSKSYLEHAKSSLSRAEKDLQDNDLLWATVAMYYAEYYALYAFLQRIGVKCENHACSILAVSHLLGEEKTKVINAHKSKRIDAQYYMKVDQENDVKMSEFSIQSLTGGTHFICRNSENSEHAQKPLQNWSGLKTCHPSMTGGF